MASPVSAMQEEGIPTLHHMNNSQSQRILWLLEELEIKYSLCLHVRGKDQRAPPELTTIQQLGKVPMLITPEKRVITESSAVAAYLLKTYDHKGKFAAEDWIRDETLTSFAGSTIGGTSTIELIFDLMANNTPWPLAYMPRALRYGVHKNFTAPEFEKALVYLEGELGDKDWFNGKMLGRCDVILSWPLDMIAQRGWIDLEEKYPRLAAWRRRILERDAWKRAMEKGNGYDLTVF